MNLVEFQEKNAARLKEAEDYTTLANNCVVSDAEDYEQAIVWSQEAKALSQGISDDISGMKTAANQLHKAISQFEKKHTGPLDAARNLFKEKALAWSKAEKAKAEEIVKKAEIERKKLEKEDLAKIKKAKPGEVIHTPPPAPVPVISTVPKVKGSHTRENWLHEVTDFKKLPEEWKIENEKALAAHAKSSKGKIPIVGVRFFNEEKLVG